MSFNLCFTLSHIKAEVHLNASLVRGTLIPNTHTNSDACIEFWPLQLRRKCFIGWLAIIDDDMQELVTKQPLTIQSPNCHGRHSVTRKMHLLCTWLDGRICTWGEYFNLCFIRSVHSGDKSDQGPFHSTSFAHGLRIWTSLWPSTSRTWFSEVRIRKCQKYRLYKDLKIMSQFNNLQQTRLTATGVSCGIQQHPHIICVCGSSKY